MGHACFLGSNLLKLPVVGMARDRAARRLLARGVRRWHLLLRPPSGGNSRRHTPEWSRRGRGDRLRRLGYRRLVATDRGILGFGPPSKNPKVRGPGGRRFFGYWA